MRYWKSNGNMIQKKCWMSLIVCNNAKPNLLIEMNDIIIPNFNSIWVEYFENIHASFTTNHDIHINLTFAMIKSLFQNNFVEISKFLSLDLLSQFDTLIPNFGASKCFVWIQGPQKPMRYLIPPLANPLIYKTLIRLVIKIYYHRDPLINKC
jgi:hypothetical protein